MNGKELLHKLRVIYSYQYKTQFMISIYIPFHDDSKNSLSSVGRFLLNLDYNNNQNPV